MIRNMYESLKQKIYEEYTIEVQDKIQLLEDGVDVGKIYEDDFTCLRNILYHDVNWYAVRGKLTATQSRSLLNMIDTFLCESLDYVSYYITTHRKGVNYENRQHKAF